MRILLVFYKLSTIIYSLCRGVIYKNGDFTWRVSDCEELSGGYLEEMMGFVLGVFLRR